MRQQADVTLLDAQSSRRTCRRARRARGATSRAAALPPTTVWSGGPACWPAGPHHPDRHRRGLRLLRCGRTVCARRRPARCPPVWRRRSLGCGAGILRQRARRAPGRVPVPLPGSDEAMKALRVLLERFDEQGGVGLSGIDFYACPVSTTRPTDGTCCCSRAWPTRSTSSPATPSRRRFGGSTDQADYRWGKRTGSRSTRCSGPPWSIPPPGGVTTVPGLPASRPTALQHRRRASHNARADAANDFQLAADRAAVRGPADVAGPDGRSSLPFGTSSPLGSRFYANLLRAG